MIRTHFKIADLSGEPLKVSVRNSYLTEQSVILICNSGDYFWWAHP